jgi:engulfment and cell motility protein 1
MTYQSSHSEDLASTILDFQASYVRITYRRKTTPVDPYNDTHANILQFIWASAKIGEKRVKSERGDGSDDILKWRLLGFESEDVTAEFSEVGVLGLDCLVRLIPFDSDG